MRIPTDIINLLEQLVKDAKFAKVVLQINVHDGRPTYRITNEISIVPGVPSSGAKPKLNKADNDKQKPQQEQIPTGNNQEMADNKNTEVQP